MGRVLQKFAHAFFEEGVCEFRSMKIVILGIETGDAASIRKAPSRVPQMPGLFGKGIILEINSSWSSPAILVPKKSLDGTQQW